MSEQRIKPIPGPHQDRAELAALSPATGRPDDAMIAFKYSAVVPAEYEQFQ
ncbi:hypothetical protein [Paenibacillus sp. 32352]|uniref:hypothetical protein n=1 Tax=Paenibacillus sp. 32352 TaxID=1969111 RepID=UPI0015C43084|nr:hypothetical protein [Paenibacillus sp. 32352]